MEAGLAGQSARAERESSRTKSATACLNSTHTHILHRPYLKLPPLGGRGGGGGGGAGESEGQGRGV
eukprot:905817-Rhodomonas_salina.1